MSGQSVHLGLVMGMSFAPWMLLALDHMARTTTIRELLRPAALLGAAGGLVVLAGDPRAISNDAIVTAVFLAALIWRDRRSHDGRWRQLLAGAAGGCALAICLSGVQWLPGLSFLHQSQRGSASLAAFGAYSLSGGQLAYLVSPFVFGGNGSLGLPTTNFNLPEFTYSVGILPLVAVFVLGTRAFTRLGSLVSPGRARRGHGSPIEPAAPGPHPAAGVFLALFLLGIVLSLGTTTPLGHLLVRIPLYGGERLQNRNMAIADLALSVLLAMFLDLLGPPVVLRRRLGPRTEEEPGGTQPLSSLSGTQQVVSEVELTRSERLAGMIPPLLVVALVVSIFCATARTERFLGATALALDLPVRMAPYYAFELIVAAVALIVVTRRRWARPPRRRLLAAGVVGLDVVMFIAMASYQPAPSGALANRNPAVNALVRAEDGSTGREAIFNPQQLAVGASPDTIDDLGLDDLVVLRHLASVQGYGSAVAAPYEDATGAHEVENLRPSALTTTIFDVLDLRVIATLPELFGTLRPSSGDLVLARGGPVAPGTSAADRQDGNRVDFAPLPPSGPWSLSSKGASVFELPGPLAIDRVALDLGQLDKTKMPPRTDLRVAVVLRSGARLSSTLSVHGSRGSLQVSPSRVVAGGGAVDIEVGLPLTKGSARTGGTYVLAAVAVHAVQWSGAVALASATGTQSTAWFQLDGMLQGLLGPSGWSYEANEGPVLLYRNAKTDGQAWLQPLGSSPQVSSRRAVGSVTQPGRAEWQDPVDDVNAPNGALLVRSEAYAPGWSATVVPARHSAGGVGQRAVAITLPVQAVGLVQGVTLPPGRWVVTWHYRSTRADLGLALAALGVLGLLALLAGGRNRPRRRRRWPLVSRQAP